MSTADTISIKQQEDLSPVSVRGLRLVLTRDLPGATFRIKVRFVMLLTIQ